MSFCALNSLFSLLAVEPDDRNNEEVHHFLCRHRLILAQTFPKYNMTPLQYAVAFTSFPEGSLEKGSHYIDRIRIVIRHMHEAGIPIDDRSSHGKTALLYLLHDTVDKRFSFRIETLKTVFLLLVEQGADPKASLGGETLLFSLFRGNVYIRSPERKEMALFLLHHGVPFQGFNKKGEPNLPFGLLLELYYEHESTPLADALYWEIKDVLPKENVASDFKRNLQYYA
jgi:hypothetical protein